MDACMSSQYGRVACVLLQMVAYIIATLNLRTQKVSGASWQLPSLPSLIPCSLHTSHALYQWWVCIICSQAFSCVSTAMTVFVGAGLLVAWILYYPTSESTGKLSKADYNLLHPSVGTGSEWWRGWWWWCGCWTLSLCHTYVCACAFVCACLYACVFTYVCACASMYACAYVCACVCAYKCRYVYMQLFQLKYLYQPLHHVHIPCPVQLHKLGTVTGLPDAAECNAVPAGGHVLECVCVQAWVWVWA